MGIESKKLAEGVWVKKEKKGNMDTEKDRSYSEGMIRKDI